KFCGSEHHDRCREVSLPDSRDDNGAAATPPEGHPLLQLIEAEDANRLLRALQRLLPGERTIIQLYYENGHSDASIAAQLAVSRRHIQRTRSRAIRRLANELSQTR